MQLVFGAVRHFPNSQQHSRGPSPSLSQGSPKERRRNRIECRWPCQWTRKVGASLAAVGSRGAGIESGLRFSSAGLPDLLTWQEHSYSAQEVQTSACQTVVSTSKMGCTLGITLATPPCQQPFGPELCRFSCRFDGPAGARRHSVRGQPCVGSGDAWRYPAVPSKRFFGYRSSLFRSSWLV